MYPYNDMAILLTVSEQIGTFVNSLKFTTFRIFLILQNGLFWNEIRMYGYRLVIILMFSYYENDESVLVIRNNNYLSIDNNWCK